MRREMWLALGSAVVLQANLAAGDLPPLIDLNVPPGTEAAPLLRVYGSETGASLGSGRSGGTGFGDFNGDGYVDLVIGEPYVDTAAGTWAGQAWIVYGGPSLRRSTIDLSQAKPPGLPPRTRIIGGRAYQSLGWSVATGDVNRDGFDDIVLGCRAFSQVTGEVTVIFGKPDLPGEVVDLNTGDAVSPAGETRIFGPDDYDSRFGYSVACADVNGDGYDDVIIGNPGYASRGRIYIAYGWSTIAGRTMHPSSGRWWGTIILGDRDPGNSPYNRVGLGYALATGDVNGDGFQDVISTSFWLQSITPHLPSSVFILYGRPQWGSWINLDTSDPVSSFGETRILGMTSLLGDGFGWSLACADVDADGFDDVLAGTIDEVFTRPDGSHGLGVLWVFFGTKARPGTLTDLNTVKGPDLAPPVSAWPLASGAVARDLVPPDAGYIVARGGGDELGWTVAGGDADGDGFDDILGGVPYAAGEGENAAYAGVAELVRGGASLRGKSLDLALNPGVTRIAGDNRGDQLGFGCRLSGDLDRDGIGEIVTSAFSGDNPSNASPENNAGYAVAVFGDGSAPSATVREYFRPGIAPRRGLGGNLSPTLRTWIEFIGGEGPGHGPSLVTGTITRSDAAISNLGRGDRADVADVMWQIESDRMFDYYADITFRLTDAEIAGLDERRLHLFQAPAPAGPWSLVARQTYDPLRNEVTGRVRELGFFAVSTAAGMPDAYEPDDRSAPVALRGDDLLTRNIFPLGDRDWMALTVDGPVLASAAALGSPSALLFNLFDVTAGAFRLVAHDVARDAVIPSVILPSGRYLFEVEDSGMDELSPGYNFSLMTWPITDALEPDNFPADARPIEVGGSQEHRGIFPVGDKDWSTFALESGAHVTAHAEASGPTLVLYLIRFGLEGQQILDLNVGQAPTVSSDVPPGTYYLMVEVWQDAGELLDYALHLTADPALGDVYEPDDRPELAGPVNPDLPPEDHSILPVSDRDWHRLVLPTAAILRATSSTTEEKTLVLSLIQFNLKGQMILESAQGQTALIERALSAGTYYLLTAEQGDDAPVSHYTFSVQVTGLSGDAYEPDSVPGQSRPIALGETQERTLEPAGDPDWVHFDLTEEATVRAAVQSDAAAVSARLMRSTALGATTVRERVGASVHLDATLAPGRYHLLIQPAALGQPATSYALSLSEGPPPDAYEPDNTHFPNAPLGRGETQAGRNLIPVGDHDWIPLQGLSGTVRVISADSPVNAVVYARLSLIDFLFMLVPIATDAGTDVAIPFAYDGSNVGPYVFTYCVAEIRAADPETFVADYSISLLGD